jgi:hypothetical protein
MSPLFLALLLGAEPNVKAATSCMEVAQSQHAACMVVVRGEVPPDRRTSAARTCSGAYLQSLEVCLTSNGIPVSDAQRARWRARAAISEALSACFAQVEHDFEWCAARGDIGRCRQTAERGFTACKAERDKQEAALDAQPLAPAPRPAP